MKQYLVDTFLFNDLTNKKLLEKIKTLPDKAESIKLFSHLVNSQYEWMARIMHDPATPGMSWWDPLYDLNRLETQWEKSLKPWLDYLNGKTDWQFTTEVTFIGYNDGLLAATRQDIALQLNYHSMHHSAQIQTIVRNRGIEPDFVDYIGTKYRKLQGLMVKGEKCMVKRFLLKGHKIIIYLT